ncbi:MAG: glycosyltransferase family 2 protein [Patescibacteria group bacterium]
MTEAHKKNKKSSISVVIVTWNAGAYIRHVLTSLLEQTYSKFDVLIIDNGSTDDTVSVIKNNYSDDVKVVEQKKNTGFSKAYNAGIHWTKGEYVLIMNQDVVLESDFLSHCAEFMSSHDVVGAVQGKVLHWNVTQNKRESVIDTCGVNVTKQHSFYNRFEGLRESDVPECEEVKPVFAFSGSLVLLRRSALVDVSYKKEYFDEDFFAYKEDVDLSWRLRHAHWDIVYLPTARAYHGRTLSSKGNHNDRSYLMQNRKKQDPFLHMISYRNHLSTLIKNQQTKNILLYAPYIFWYELQKIVYMVVFERSTFKGIFSFIKQLPKTLKKRKRILENSHLKSATFKEWTKEV